MTGLRAAHPTLEELPETILDRAALRAKDQGAPYAGLVTPIEAYALMLAGVATLIDVRTRFEHEYVGRVPDTPLIEWKPLGAAAPNPQFVAQVEALEGQRDNLLFLCRSGVRSHAAATALAAAGHEHAYNIVEGFEGDLDEHGHRGAAGWRHAGLPWVQS